MPQDNYAIVDRFFAAIEANDGAAIDALYSADFAIWHSFDRRTKGRRESLDMLASAGRLIDLHYEVHERLSVGNRVVQRHDLTFRTTRDDEPTCLSAVVFLTIAEGKIVRIEEYIDSSDADLIGSAISAMQADT